MCACAVRSALCATDVPACLLFLCKHVRFLFPAAKPLSIANCMQQLHLKDHPRCTGSLPHIDSVCSCQDCVGCCAVSLLQVLGYIRAAKRPVVLLGGGCVGCDEALLNELVDVMGAPVVYTFMGKVGMHVYISCAHASDCHGSQSHERRAHYCQLQQRKQAAAADEYVLLHVAVVVTTHTLHTPVSQLLGSHINDSTDPVCRLLQNVLHGTGLHQRRPPSLPGSLGCARPVHSQHSHQPV